MLQINEILKVEPYYITVLFNNSEKRKINFTEIMERFPVLKNENIFLSVKLDDYPTLHWENLARMIDYNGDEIPAPLDFSPDTLYRYSTPI